MSPPAAPDASHFLQSERNGLRLYTYRWSPDPAATVRAVAFLSHGVSEHSGRYEKLATALASRGVLAFAHDHQGHGYSDGVRGDQRDFALLVDDILQHCRVVAAEYPGLPVFIFGHSMGADLAYLAVLKQMSLFRAAVFSAPPVIPDPATATPFKVFMARAMCHVWPSMPIGRINPALTSRDPEAVRQYEADPLVFHGSGTVGIAMALLQMVDTVRARAEEASLPLLIVQGTADRVTNAESAKEFYQRAKSEDKELKLYEGFFHSLIHEPSPDGERVVQDIAAWIEARLPQ